ncbi:hypothetical protein EVAR_92641_1 [Eumeta japonica]|uniref:Uncharacterized protein n=1 Tax=Eumeta variegata TaxID=151549 RepID=A0A4C1SZS1_EUMVA|nr:hypothetical protein EVAR_92641_1 [Eumeta japonica]
MSPKITSRYTNEQTGRTFFALNYKIIKKLKASAPSVVEISDYIKNGRIGETFYRLPFHGNETERVDEIGPNYCEGGGAGRGGGTPHLADRLRRSADARSTTNADAVSGPRRAGGALGRPRRAAGPPSGEATRPRASPKAKTQSYELLWHHRDTRPRTAAADVLARGARPGPPTFVRGAPFRNPFTNFVARACAFFIARICGPGTCDESAARRPRAAPVWLHRRA